MGIAISLKYTDSPVNLKKVCLFRLPSRLPKNSSGYPLKPLLNQHFYENLNTIPFKKEQDQCARGLPY